MADPVADLTTRLLEKALDCTAVQHRVAIGNLANLETPGYTARRVTFEDRLRVALRAEERGGDPRGLRRVTAEVTARTDAAGPDGNNVNVETEMLAVGEASLRYQVITRMLDRKLEMVGIAIGDGRSA